ncbi:DNA gyrase inhibitor YacG [Roseomonas sp. GC11]|uniref:DNA gyrase inhibitor YacG n=1 Tax=Roseomonas sp. GC11 TaxID=2950546 RepID=UPI00210D737B|nr:DNA gyrase inhibitor YacG [Roseomonas sp. GC11]MCQ4159811.1 DNA gyrase inhibitor YacG [Roseomonas sp. GC11]
MPSDTPPAPRPPRRAACPVCGKPAATGHRPFCSDRCRQVDLGRWLSGGYVIPGRPAEPENEDEEQGFQP